MIIIFGLLITLVLVLFDQASKYVILHSLGLNNPVVVIPKILQVRGVYNTGAAFSIFADQKIFLILISLVAFLFITYLMKDFSLKRRPLYSIALVLIYSGTIGNMIDRIFYADGVFDFIEVLFVSFAIFNIADSLLTIGVILMAIYLLFFDKKDPVSLKFNKKEFISKFKKEELENETIN